MLEGKSEKLEVSRDVELTPLKNKMSKNKTKTLKKKLREEREMNTKTTENDPSGDIKMILGPITLRYNLGLFILFFETINLGLHYVPEKSILIERGYLD